MLFKILVIGADHGGFALKESLKDAAISWGVHVIDVGTFSQTSVDYPDVVASFLKELRQHQVAERQDNNTKSMVSLQSDVCGVLICGSGLGMSMAANRIQGLRAALCYDTTTAQLARRHNDANVLVLGGRFLENRKAENILHLFLTTPFDGDRHEKRIKKIDELS